MKLFSIGHFSGAGAQLADHIDRDAMLVYCGQFDSADGPVEIKPEHVEKLASVHNEGIKHLSEGADAKNFPPIQLDHSTSARDTVGRLIGPLSVGDFEGKKALFGKVRILGKENVEKVADGRWTHLSIGADLDSGKLNELTITPFPAAPNAAMLHKFSRKTVHTGEFLGVKYEVVEDAPTDKAGDGDKRACYYVSPLNAKFDDIPTAEAAIKKYIERKNASGKPTSLSGQKGDSAMDKEKLKKHLMEHHKMSEKDADEKLSNLSAEDEKKYGDEMSAAKDPDKDDKSEKEMTAAKAKLTELRGKIKTSLGTVQLAKRRMSVQTRLSRMVSLAKMTPAEVKKVDVEDLVKQTDEALNAFFKGYELRENVIHVGMAGTQKAASVVELQKQRDRESLEAETRANMSSVPKKTRMSNAELCGDRQESEMSEGEYPVQEHMKHLEHVHSLMTGGQHEEAMKHLMEAMGKLRTHQMSGGAEMHPTEATMSAFTESANTLEAQVNEALELLSPIIGK